MEELDFNKTFRFVLYQNNVLLYERIFDGGVISPYTRNSVDIRKDLFGIIKKIQNVLSKNTYDTQYLVKEKVVYDFDEYNEKLLSLYGQAYNPEVVIKKIEDREIRGVPCKLCFYINENLIVERNIYVDKFNPDSKNSCDLVETLNEIVFDLEKTLIKKDVSNIWDDYDIIKKTNMSIHQVREISPRERKMILSRR